MLKAPMVAKTPDLAPRLVGLKVTLKEHDAPAPRLCGQLGVCEKSPVMLMLPTARGWLPVFDKVTVCATLVVCNTWAAKVSESGDTEAIAPSPVPLRLAVKLPPSVTMVSNALL